MFAALPETRSARLWHICTGSAEPLLWNRAAMLLTDGSVYADKEALSCRSGQLSQPNSEPQHLSGRLAEEQSWGRPDAPWNVRLQHVHLGENSAIHSTVSVAWPRKRISDKTSRRASQTIPDLCSDKEGVRWVLMWFYVGPLFLEPRRAVTKNSERCFARKAAKRIRIHPGGCDC